MSSENSLLLFWAVVALVIVRGRDKDFRVPKSFEHTYRKNKIKKGEGFFATPFTFTNPFLSNILYHSQVYV
jgi:hypothetical protein